MNRKSFILKEDHPFREDLVKGTTVFEYWGYDYGLAGDDTHATGEEYVCITLDAQGGIPFVTCPSRILEEIKDDPDLPS